MKHVIAIIAALFALTLSAATQPTEAEKAREVLAVYDRAIVTAVMNANLFALAGYDKVALAFRLRAEAYEQAAATVRRVFDLPLQDLTTQPSAKDEPIYRTGHSDTDDAQDGLRFGVDGHREESGLRPQRPQLDAGKSQRGQNNHRANHRRD